MERLSVHDAFQRGSEATVGDWTPEMGAIPPAEAHRRAEAYLRSLGLDPDSFREEFLAEISENAVPTVFSLPASLPAVLLDCFLSGIEYGRGNDAPR